MSHRYLTDPSLSSTIQPSHTSNNPAMLLNEFGPRRSTDPVELRRLVLDYLCHQCFVDTASAFARESANSHNESSLENMSKAVDPKTTGPTLTTKSSRSTLAVKDTVVERTVRFDTDDDGDAEMGDLHNASGSHPASQSNAAEAPSFAEGILPNSANGSSSLYDGQPAGHKDGSPLNPSSSADRAESYPDWTAQDVQTTRIRLAIKEHIIQGKIKEAIKLIETHFPAVLGSSLIPKPNGNLSTGNCLTTSQNSKNSKGPRFKSSRIAVTNRPLSGNLSASSPSHVGLKSSNLSSDSPSRPPSDLRQTLTNTNGSSLASHQTSSSLMISSQHHQVPHAIFGSLNPAHIALNLQIQFFVEFVRSISQSQLQHHSNGFDHEACENQARGSSVGAMGEDGPQANGKSGENVARKPASGTSPHSHSGGASNGLGNDLSNSVGCLSDDTSTTSSSISTRTTSLALSLPHCRALHDFVHQLPEPIERAIFAKELENVAGLLAYVDPWDSPVRKYLDQSRRDLLAQKVNAAILVHLGRSPTSILQLVAQQTCFTWSMLSDFGATIPCPTADDKSRTKKCTSFNLHDFVNLHDFGSSPATGSG